MLAKVVIATHNPAKKTRYGRLLKDLAKEVISLADLDISEKPYESGQTAEENAEIKACYYANLTRLPAFSIDEAIYLNHLPPEKQPGIACRRIEGKEEASDDELLAYWEAVVASLPPDKRTGYWHTAYCLATPDGKMQTTAVNIPIMFFSPSSKIRIPGWPMSSLEGPVGFQKPHSEMTEEEHQKHNKEIDRLIIEKLKVFGV